MKTPETRTPPPEKAGINYAVMSGEMFQAALREARKAGTCFICTSQRFRRDGREAATHVLLDIDTYRSLLHYAPRPMSAKFWDHSYVEPEEFEDEMERSDRGETT